MFRLYARLTLIPITLFTAVLLLTHAKPYDDHGLRQLLVPEGCPAPCFMGIRPDVTSEDEALALLKASTWVVDAQKITYQIAWTWGANAPASFEMESPASRLVVYNLITLNNRLVSSISYSTRFTLGEVVLAWGLPATSQLTLLNPSGAASLSIPANIALDYDQAGFVATAFLSCPYTADIWRAPLYFTVAGNLRTISIAPIMTIQRQSFLTAIRRSSNRACG